MDLNSLDDLLGALDNEELLARLQGTSRVSNDEDEEDDEAPAPLAAKAPDAQKPSESAAAQREPEKLTPADADADPLDFDFDYPTLSDPSVAIEQGNPTLSASEAELTDEPDFSDVSFDADPTPTASEADPAILGALSAPETDEESEGLAAGDSSEEWEFGDDAPETALDESGQPAPAAHDDDAEYEDPSHTAPQGLGHGDFAHLVAESNDNPFDGAGPSPDHAARQKRDDSLGAALAVAAGLAGTGAGIVALREREEAKAQDKSAAAPQAPGSHFDRKAKPTPAVDAADASNSAKEQPAIKRGLPPLAAARVDGQASKLRKPAAVRAQDSAAPSRQPVAQPAPQTLAHSTSDASKAPEAPPANAAPKIATPSAARADFDSTAAVGAESGAMGFFKAPGQRPFAPEMPQKPEALRGKNGPNPYLAALSPRLRGSGTLDPRHARVASEAIAAQALAFRLARADAPLLRWSANGLDDEPSTQTLELAFFGAPAEGPLCSSLDLAPAQDSLIELFAALWRMSRAPTGRAFAVAAQSASERAQPWRDKLRAQWDDLQGALARQHPIEGARLERVGLSLELCERVLWSLSPERVADALMAARMENRPRATAQDLPEGFFDSVWARASSPLRRVLEDAASRKAEKRAIVAYGSDAPGSSIWRQACKKHLIDGLRQAVESLNRFGLASFEIHGISIEGPFDLAERAQRFTSAASRACQKLGARSRAFGLSRRLGVSLDDPRLSLHPQSPLALFDLAGCRALASSRFAGLDASLMHEWTHALDARSGAALMGPKAWLEAGCPFASALSARLSQRGKRLDELTLPDRLHGVPAPKEEPAGDDDGLRAYLESQKSRENKSSKKGKGIRANAASDWSHSIESPFDAPSEHTEPLTAEAILGAPSDPLDLEILLASAARATPAKRLARAWGDLVTGAIGAHEGLSAWSGHARLTAEDGPSKRRATQAAAQNIPFDPQELARLESRAAAQTLRPILARALTVCGEPLARDPKALRSMLLAFGPEAKPWLDGLAAALASGGAANFKTRLKRVKNRLKIEMEEAIARGEGFELEEGSSSEGRGTAGKGGKGRGSGSSVVMPESLWARSLSEFGRLREAFVSAKSSPHAQDKLLGEAGVSRDQFARAREAEKSLEAQLGSLTRDAAQKMIRKSRMLGRPVQNPEQLALALLTSAENALDAIAQWALTHTAEGHFSPRPNAFFAESARMQFQDPNSAFASRWRSSDELAARAVENLAPKASWLDFARPQAAAFNIPLGPQGRDRLRTSLREICKALQLPVSKTGFGPETLGERALAMQEALLSKFDAMRSARALEDSKATLLRRPPSRH